MDRFREEYEKLHRALKTSYESEKRLVKKCKELTDTIAGNLTRVKAAIRLTQEDSTTIAVLKKEVDRAWRLVEQAKEKEDVARKIIVDLKSEVAHLHKIVEAGSGLSFAQDNTVQQLMSAKEELSKEIKNSQDANIELQRQNADLAEKGNRLDAELAKEKDKLKEMQQKLEDSLNQNKRTDRLKEGLEKEKEALQSDNEKVSEKLDKEQESGKRMMNEIARLKDNFTTLESQHKTLQEEKRKIQEACSQSEHQKDKLNSAKIKIEAEKIEYEKGLNLAKANIRDSEKEINKQTRTIVQIQKKKEDLET